MGRWEICKRFAKKDIPLGRIIWQKGAISIGGAKPSLGVQKPGLRVHLHPERDIKLHPCLECGSATGH